MKSVTGLTVTQANYLSDMILENSIVTGLPPIMPIWKGVLIALIYLGRNRTQEDLAFT